MQNNPFGLGGQFYRGNMHTHSTRSDGRLSPEEAVAAYREAGYDFLVLSDHFMAQYEWPVTDTSPYRTPGFTTILGAELHAPRTEVGELWHIKAVGLPVDFAPASPEETGPDLARRAAATGAFIGIVHPSWYGLTHRDAESIEVAHAVEIYNHSSHTEVDRGADWPFLDKMLNEGRRLTGYASDDAHFWNEDAFGGWVNVQADRLDPDVLLASLKAGRYYSSQGPEIHNVEFRDSAVHVSCSPAHVVAITGRGSRSQHEKGGGITTASLSLARFKDGYVRVTVMDDQGRRAWTNPFWLD